MALINCPECGKEISDQVKVCPHCGYPIRKNNLLANIKTNKKALAIAGAVVVIVAVAVPVGRGMAERNRQVSRMKEYVTDGRLSDAQSYYQQHTDSSFRKKADQIVDKQYESLIAAGEYEAAADIFNSGLITADDLADCKDEIVRNLELATESFVAGSISYDDAIAIVDGYESFHDDTILDKRVDALTTIKQLNESQEAFEQATEYLAQGEQQKAYEAYAKVIEDDANYAEAQESMASLRDDIIAGLVADAESEAAEENYSAALARINKALKFDSENTELASLQTQYEQAADEAAEQKAAAEREAALMKDGEVITGDHVEAKFVSAKVTRTINPTDMSGYYHYYEPIDGEVFLDVQFTLKNIGKNDLDLNSVIKDLQVTYNEDYTYTTYGLYTSNSSTVDRVYSWDDLDPLQSIAFHVVATLPEEVETSKLPLEMEFSIDGVKKIVVIR